MMSNEITRFSDFIRNASVTEKEKVFKRVLERANKRQEEIMATVSNRSILDDIEAELARARSKFPRNEDLIVALMEEVGELANAMLEHKHEPEKQRTHCEIYKEAVQAAVMAIRVATEGDLAYPYHPESGYRGPADEIERLRAELESVSEMPKVTKWRWAIYCGDHYEVSPKPLSESEVREWYPQNTGYIQKIIGRIEETKV